MLSLKVIRKLCFTVLIISALLTAAGISAAEESGGVFEITGITGAMNGSLKVSWTDPQNNAPYRVLFQPVTSANQERPSNELLVWCNSGEISGTEYTENYVVPDASWWFVVEDSAGNQAVRKYEGKKYNFDSAWALEISGQSQSAKRGNGTTRFADTGNDRFGFPVLLEEDINSAGDDVYYGVRLIYKCKDGSAYGAYLLKYAMEPMADTGFVADNSPMVVGLTQDTSMPIVFSAEYRTMESFVYLSPYFKRIAGQGSDMKGMYRLKIYFDGELAGDIPVQVK